MAEKFKFSKKGMKCPSCPSSDAFFPIIKKNGEIDYETGKCFSCGQFFVSKSNFKPKDYEYEIKPTFNISPDFLEKLKDNPLVDNFSTELLRRYNDIGYYLKRYNVVCASISGNKKWRNFTGFPKIDFSQKIRSVKCFLYDENIKTTFYTIKQDGKRDKKVKNISWLHTLKPELYDSEKTDFVDCFFGEHLIFSTDYKYIGVVESEKTAIISNYFFGNDWIFLATGSKANISKLPLKGINDKKVVLFPDADGLKAWTDFVQKNNNPNFIISDYCEKLKDKEDIADIFLNTNNGSEVVEITNNQIEKAFDSEISERKISAHIVTNFEVQFYDSILSKLLTTIDLRKILEIHNIDITNVQFTKTKSGVKIIKDDAPVTLFELFLQENKEEEFYRFLKIKHIPKFEWTKNFSFSFSDEEFLKYLKDFNDIFFDNLQYDIVSQQFMQKENIINDFDLEAHIRQSIEMLLISNLNERNIRQFLTPSKTQILTKFCEETENQRVSNINFAKTFGQKYEKILNEGKEQMDALGFSADKEDTVLPYIIKKLQGLFKISDFDISQLVFFCAATIRKKFYDEFQWGKMLVLSGDSGVGKDTFFPSMLVGSYAIDNEHIFSEKQKSGEFTTLTPKMAKKIMYTIVSDDLEASNLTGINDITKPTYHINNKGVQMKVVKNSFNKIITSNFERILFSKEVDRNAIARRYINVKINYLSGNKSDDYLHFFKTNEKNFYPFYSLFFTYCFELAKNVEILREIEAIIIQKNCNMVDNLIYLNNDDMIVIENFQAYVQNELEGQNLYSQKIFSTAIGSEKVLLLKSVPYKTFSPKKESSIKRIKEVLSIYYKTLTFNRPVRYNGEVSKYDTLAVSDFNNGASENAELNNNNETKINLTW
jgi:hypothetical protein